MIHTVQIVRDLLSLVGFSNITTQAGFSNLDATTTTSATAVSGIVGGERALLQEIVQFRTALRDLTLNKIAREDETRNELLSLCDELRESTFPALGIELNDVKSTNRTANTTNLSWSYCIPRSRKNDATSVDEIKSQNRKQQQQQQQLLDIPLQDYFRVGPYQGQFSAFDDSTGFPTHNTDGTELSKNQIKKLTKKRNAHEKRMQEKQKEKRDS